MTAPKVKVKQEQLRRDYSKSGRFHQGESSMFLPDTPTAWRIFQPERDMKNARFQKEPGVF